MRQKQLEAFQNDVAKGGNLVVLHYLYPSTVNYLREFIQIAKATGMHIHGHAKATCGLTKFVTGKQLMRVDQCLEDPSAPPL